MRPGGATVLAIAPEDRFTVIDVDGGQAAELTMLAPDGTDAAEAIGARADAPATVVRALVSSMVDGARRSCRICRPRAGPEPRDGRPAVRRVVAARAPNSRSAPTARACSIVIAPAGRLVDGAPPPSDLVVEVHRARPRTAQEVELPAPLAEPRLDFRIDRSTARSYEVQAGEFIQMIDVEGSSARTSWRSTGASSRTGSNAGSTRP